MLLELAVGDAYGAGFEYVNNQLIRQFNTLERYHKHPRHSIKPGCYTDDTQMTLAIAEAIVDNDPWTPLSLASRFVEVFKRDPREGYAQGFFQFLLGVTGGEDFLARIQPTSDKSGAAMRTGPIGIFPTLEEVKERATIQAKLTHDTPDGIRAAVAAALAVHYCLYHLGPTRNLGEFLESYVEGEWSIPWQGKVGPKGWMSTHAAITALTASAKMSGLLRRCVDFGGDVDTVATIALAAGSCSSGLEQDLPVDLIASLENGVYGHDYIQNLDRQLMSLVNKA